MKMHVCMNVTSLMYKSRSNISCKCVVKMPLYVCVRVYVYVFFNVCMMYEDVCMYECCFINV
jgi:hypothetical protein